MREMHTAFWLGNLKEDHLKDPGIDGRIILKLTFDKCDGSIDWIDLARDKQRKWASVKAVINLRVK
jgi:hypothetical protein